MCPFEPTSFTGVIHGIGYILLVVLFQMCIFAGVVALDKINLKLEYIGRDALLFFPVIYSHSWAFLLHSQVFILSFMFSLMTISILMKWCLLGRVEAGEHAITLWMVWRFWFVHNLLGCTHQTVTPFWMWSIACNLYVKLLGADIDLVGTHLSDLTHLTTQFDLLSIGRNTFVAGNVSLRCMMVDSERAVVEFTSTTIGNGGYIGNSSVVCPGCTMADLVVIADFAVVRPRTELLQLTMVIGDSCVVSRGAPRIDSVLIQQMDSLLKQRPKWWFVVARILVTVYVLFALTSSLIASFEVMFKISSDVNNLAGFGIFDPHKFFGWQPAQFCFLWRPVVAIVQLGTLGCIAFLHKWLFIGRIVVGANQAPHGMDSMFVLLYWMCTMLWALFCSLLKPFSGTPLVSFLYTLMGANVGSDVKIFSTFVLCDFDAFKVRHAQLCELHASLNSLLSLICACCL